MSRWGRIRLWYVDHRRRLGRSTVDLFDLLGCIAIVTGAAMVYPPAGWITAGVLCLLVARHVHGRIDP